MANISITSHCNRRCGYCFAGRTEKDSATDMSRETLTAALDLLERSGIHEARLLGGEPTLHPDFPSMVELILQRDLRLTLFTNGLIPGPALDALGEVPGERLELLVNVDPPESTPAARRRQLHRTLELLGPCAVLGFNIARPGVSLGFLLDLQQRHRARPRVRLGLAHPRLDRGNQFLRPDHFAEVGKRVVSFARRAAARGVKLELDCGFVPCMFPAGAAAELGVEPGALGRRCNPLPDILPDGAVVPCYPLSDLEGASLELSGELTVQALQRRLERTLRPYRRLGIFRDCDACAVRDQGACLGGCLAAAMGRLRRTPLEVHLPAEIVSSSGGERATRARWSIPYIDQPPDFWRELRQEHGDLLQEVYFPLPDQRVGSGRPARPARHLEAFLRQRPLPPAVLVNPITLPGPVEEVAEPLVQRLERMEAEYGLSGVTVSNVQLGALIRQRLPGLRLTASVLMDICSPVQALMLEDTFQGLVPASRVMRNLPALRRLRQAFPGRLRLLVNEACLPGCPCRVQHFQEMASSARHPRSLCDGMLARSPWLRLTGSWVLPQHLHLFDQIADELKLAGRATMADPAVYRRILRAYVRGQPLTPDAIGGGPASVLEPMQISGEFYEQTLTCGQRCHTCSTCREYHAAHGVGAKSP